ncbi:MAG: hypothetical protein GF329_09400 [Candidatus Lokiarchaeota archaeon]|nr:hypothetical protein [Candidatus Lokiarchaeota archaeon]
MHRNPELAAAFGFNSVPSHQTMCDFRKRLGPERLLKIMIKVIKIAIEMGLSDTNELIIDSATIKSHVNFAKANKKPRFDIEKNKDLYRYLELKNIISEFDLHIRTHYSLVSVIAFQIFKVTGGFLSFNSAYNFVKEREDLRKIFGFMDKFPVQATIKSILQKLEKSSKFKTLMHKIIDKLVIFFQMNINDTGSIYKNLKYFFGILREKHSIIGPDAKIGYCESKDEYYLGYKVHLIISKKNPLL